MNMAHRALPPLHEGVGSPGNGSPYRSSARWRLVKRTTPDGDTPFRSSSFTDFRRRWSSLVVLSPPMRLPRSPPPPPPPRRARMPLFLYFLFSLTSLPPPPPKPYFLCVISFFSSALSISVFFFLFLFLQAQQPLPPTPTPGPWPCPLLSHVSTWCLATMGGGGGVAVPPPDPPVWLSPPRLVTRATRGDKGVREGLGPGRGGWGFTFGCLFLFYLVRPFSSFILARVCPLFFHDSLSLVGPGSSARRAAVVVFGQAIVPANRPPTPYLQPAHSPRPTLARVESSQQKKKSAKQFSKGNALLRET